MAPKWFSPEPLAPQNLALHATIAVVALAAILVLTERFAAWLDSRLAKAGAALAWVAVAAALGAALYFRGRHAPLVLGVWIVALPVWSALATLAAAAAEQW